MHYEIGQEVRVSRTGYYVYGLLDDAGMCFYIGVTVDPARRLAEHIRGQFNPRVKERISAVKDRRLVVLSEPLPKKEALELESELIAAIQGLANQEHRQDYRTQHSRHPAIERLLRDASKVQEMASIGGSGPPLLTRSPSPQGSL